MRRYWGYAAMLLLGISLSVGFYEGRALVQNTARALSQATTITDTPGAHRERRRDAQDRGVALGADEVGVAAVERKRRPRRGGPVGAGDDKPSQLIAPVVGPRERLELLRTPGAGPRAPRGLRTGLDAKLAVPAKAEPEPLDTGTEPSPE